MCLPSAFTIKDRWLRLAVIAFGHWLIFLRILAAFLFSFCLWISPAHAQQVGSVDLSNVTFNSLPPYQEAGDIASAGDLSVEMGYDPARHWEAGDQPADVFTLGDFQSSFRTQELNLDQVAQLSGLDLQQLRIDDVPFFEGKTFAEVAEAVPALKEFSLEEIPALAEVFDADLSTTVGELIDTDELIGEMNFNDLVGEFSVMDIPNLDLAALDSFENWQTTAMSEVPGLSDIGLGKLSQVPDIFSGVTGTHDISFGAKENTRTLTRHSITGSNKDGFSVQCAQKRGCAHVELTGAGNMHGAQWIAGGEGEGQQMVNGGESVLGAVNGGKEPTGRHPFGEMFKVVLDKTSESKGTAEFALYFKYCYKGPPVDLGCTPYFLGPVPMPILNSKEKGMIITGFLDAFGGITSGLQAPKAWEKLSPPPTQEVKDVVNTNGGRFGTNRGGGSRSLCGEGPGRVDFHALAEAIHSIESSGGGDSYTVPGGLYVDGAPYGYPKERGYALGRYQYMSYRADVAAIISAKPGGAAFLERAFYGQQPTRAEIAKYFTSDEQDRLFTEDQSNTIQSLLDQGYSGDRILEILGQMHFGGDVVANGTLDSTSISDGYGTLSLWDYGQITKQVYHETIKSSGESICGQGTGSYRNPTAGYKPHDLFDANGTYGRVHKGVDVGGNMGDPVFAADGGTIYIEDHGAYSWGLHITLDHGGSKTLYGHLSEVLVKQGDLVSKGDVIGTIGSSGKSSGPHLHFEVIENGQRIDPDSVVDWNDY